MLEYLMPLLVGLFVFGILYFALIVKPSKETDTSKDKEMLPLFLWRTLVPQKSSPDTPSQP